MFEVFLRQIEVDEYPLAMTPDDLRNCVLEYCQKQKDRLEVCVQNITYNEISDTWNTCTENRIHFKLWN